MFSLTDDTMLKGVLIKCFVSEDALTWLKSQRIVECSVRLVTDTRKLENISSSVLGFASCYINVTVQVPAVRT